MTGFSLIQKLEQDLLNPPTKPSGIKYQQYDVIVENAQITINIPLRETDKFEEEMIKHGNTTMSRRTLKQLLRQFRGTQG